MTGKSTLNGMIVSLCAVFATACGTPEEKAPTTVHAQAETPYDLFHLENEAGQKSSVVHMSTDDYKEYRSLKGELPGWQVFVRGENYDLSETLRHSLRQQGMTTKMANTLTDMLSNKYSSLSGFMPDANAPFYIKSSDSATSIASLDKQFGPSARLYDENGKLRLTSLLSEPQSTFIYGDNPMPAPFCVVSGTSQSFSGSEWTTALLGIDTDPGKTYQSDHEFGEEFSTFIMNHELSHCMGADEPRADMIASIFMLKTHPNPEKAVAFLKHFRDIRAVSSMLSNASELYDGNHNAIASVLREYEDNPNAFNDLSDKEIWSKALERDDMGEPVVKALREHVQSNTSFGKNPDLTQMAQLLSRIGHSMDETGAREQVLSISRSVSSLAEGIQTKTPKIAAPVNPAARMDIKNPS